MADVFTHNAKAIVTNRILGAGTEPKYIGWSKSGTAATTAHTKLDSEVALDLSTLTGTRVTGTSSRITTTQTNDTYQVTGTLTCAAGAGGTVQQAALFDTNVIDSVGIYIMSSFTGIALSPGDSIAFTFKHTVT